LSSALAQLVRCGASLDGRFAERHLGLRLGAEDQGGPDVVAFAGPLGQVLVGGVLGAFPDGDVDGAALVVDALDGLEVPARGLGPAVGAPYLTFPLSAMYVSLAPDP
jgi:hypothetical protein